MAAFMEYPPPQMPNKRTAAKAVDLSDGFKCPLGDYCTVARKCFQRRLWLDFAAGLVSPRALRFIKQLVSSVVKCCEIFTVTNFCYAHAGGYGSFDAQNSMSNNRRNSLTSQFSLDIGIGTAQEKHEFFSAKSVGAHCRTSLKRTGNGLQHFISDTVSVQIIDRLEIININDSHCGEAFALKLLELPFDCSPIE